MHPSASSLHSRREALGFGASGLGLAVAGSVLNAVSARAATDKPGAPRSAGPLQSAGAMTFGPGNVLFVGDIAGSAVHGFALRDEDLTPQTGVELGNFHNFEGVDRPHHPQRQELFVADSPLEGAGFEMSVPRRKRSEALCSPFGNGTVMEATKVRLEAVVYLRVPMVRIHFPPAVSQANFRIALVAPDVE